MTSIRIVILILTAGLAISVSAQHITHKDFRNNELKQRYEYFKALEERRAQSLLLDQSDYDIKHYCLDLDFTDVTGQTISGTVTTLVSIITDGVNEIEYNLKDAMTVIAVKVGGQDVTFSHQNDIINIQLDRSYDSGELLSTEIEYNGHPADDMRTFVWDYHGSQPMISTHSFTHGTSEWWPCKDTNDDKADSADIYITVADDLTATSNGLLISDTDNGNGTRTLHWHSYYPIAAYLIAIAVSDYVNFTDWYFYTDDDSMPIVNYVFQENLDDAIEDLNITSHVLEIFSRLFGEYPFLNEKYGHSLWTWGGAMEHQCNTFYGKDLISGYHYCDWIVAHEASHMWFSDMITCETWPDIWLNEGFASYCEALYIEAVLGAESMRSYQTNQNAVMNPSGPIYDPDPLLDANTVYSKGSWVVHMLRGVMGDEAFFAGIKAYAADPRFRYGSATTAEFEEVMEQYYGGDLDWFFDQWLLEMNKPSYRYSRMVEDIGNGQYEAFYHIEQYQGAPAPEVFVMPMQITMKIDGVDTIFVVLNDSRVADYRFIINGIPNGMGLDDYNWILKIAVPEAYGMNIVVTELPVGHQTEYYQALIEARGGDTPYTFEVSDGNLPPGLTLNSETGMLTGTQSTIGECQFTVTCTDSDNPAHLDSQEYVLVIEESSGIEDDNFRDLPKSFELYGNYPNPFNAATSISFRLAKSQSVSLDIYNLLGQQVEELYRGQLNAGMHAFIWDADEVPSGIYFYRLDTGDQFAIKKMTLLK